MFPALNRITFFLWCHLEGINFTRKLQKFQKIFFRRISQEEFRRIPRYTVQLDKD